MDVWYTKFGFDENPFTVKPVGGIVGHDDEFATINAKLAVGEVMLLTGNYGFGKSTLLQAVVSRFKAKKPVAYYSCNTSDETVDFDKMLINAGGFLRRLLGIRKKGVILLLDEVQDVNARSISLLPTYFSKGFFHSIALVTSRQESLKLPRQLVELIGENIFEIGGISEDDAVALVRRRFSHPEFFPDNAVRKIFSYDPSPRAILKNCEDVCRYASSKGKDKVTLLDVKHALG